MEIEYFSGGRETAVYEFKQETGESDTEFYENFVKSLHKSEVTTGFVSYFVFLGLRRYERLTPWAYKWLESKVTDCFEKSNGWLYEDNRRMRFRLTIRLVISKQAGLKKLIHRSAEGQERFYRAREKALRHFVDSKKVFYNIMDPYA